METDLVYNVRACGTCQFFWPTQTPQPYGPYPSYDFAANTPSENLPAGAGGSFAWIAGTTLPETFPNPEVMDGCRKAPIMTIGINPNLTAFASGTQGAAWCYPQFSSQGGTDAWTKYAYYYRYRSVYQEHFDLAFIEPYLLPDGKVLATKAGVIKKVIRASDDPAFELRVQYAGDAHLSSVHVPGKLGQPRYVVVVDLGQAFAAGDLLAAQLNVPPGQDVTIYAEPIGYYTQILPVLSTFETFLKQQGHADANLRVGEDVGQIDMVACATPHWGSAWLGGTSQSVKNIVANCVHKNAWAFKQLIQTAPAIVFLVGQSSWDMFREFFGDLLQATSPLPKIPEDGPYTLLRLTTQQECRLSISATVDGRTFSLSTRIVITPHFSYNENFLPQFRMSSAAAKTFAAQYPATIAFLKRDSRVTYQAPAGSFVAFALQRDAPGVLADLTAQDPHAAAALNSFYYDPHAMMAAVLAGMYANGGLAYTAPANDQAGFLTRGEGPCTFCVNDHWRFPQGCPYGKPDEAQWPAGFLEQVCAAVMDRTKNTHVKVVGQFEPRLSY